MRTLSLYGVSDNLRSNELLFVFALVIFIDFLVIGSAAFFASNKYNNFWQRKLGSKNA
jgi:high-affinity Fe2+/Pb2+ permease